MKENESVARNSRRRWSETNQLVPRRSTAAPHPTLNREATALPTV